MASFKYLFFCIFNKVVNKNLSKMEKTMKIRDFQAFIFPKGDEER